ncbi:hypothetical protein CC86DRAFT_414327 [Ophiobolus disseminans]|uniref:Uncharacterized protein n=1 Tax=Ophiobolus disseminans TaxID=1469910 RepID=A0A6A7AJB5_9PLEO|nr:hypothetical protein CC86DRAFT_414327 [Ophiobolus disseminans]
MLLTYILTALFSAIPTTTSLPTELAAYSAPRLYSCGYLLFIRNQNVHVSLSGTDRCKPVYFNTTSGTYLEAFGYNVYGGCECKFFGTKTSCDENTDSPIFVGPTSAEMYRWLEFEDPKPKWYNCGVH